MTIIASAVRSIQIGIEDFDDATRIVSSVRNVHAGILLLFKEKLRRLSPPDSNESLIKQRIVPTRDAAGAIVFVGDGKNTVDVREIRNRFSQLGITADWSSVERLTTIRNNVEHYFASDPAQVLQEAMARAVAIANGFIRSELGEDPATLLGPTSWERMLALKEVFEREKAECRASMDQIPWIGTALRHAVHLFECDDCSSSLLEPVDTTATPPDVTLKCRACGHTIDYAEKAAELIKDAFWGESFEAAKEGYDPPLYDCPSCGEEAYITQDDRCGSCGYEREHKECLICHEYLSPDEQDLGGLCFYHADVIVLPQSEVEFSLTGVSITLEGEIPDEYRLGTVAAT